MIQGQPELYSEFQASLGYSVRPCLKQTKEGGGRVRGGGGKREEESDLLELWGLCGRSLS